MNGRLCIPKKLEGGIFEAAHDAQLVQGCYRPTSLLGRMYS